VNQRLGAAIAALAVISVPALVSAGPSSWAIVTAWDHSDHVVAALDHLWSPVRLKHLATTQHEWINIRANFPHQNGLPPDPCKPIAEEWDGAVIASNIFRRHDFTATFEHLLGKMSDHQCKISFVGGTTNGDGSTNLNSVSPSGTASP
jgi:hypothetical protein